MIIKENSVVLKKMEMTLTEKLTQAFEPEVLSIVDESSKHANHNPDALKGETHFKVKIVSKKFQGVSKLERHRWVYKVLDAELKNGIHALELITQDPDE